MCQPYEKNWARLPLEGADNVRELGGYPVAGGGQTRYHRFLRADRMSGLTASDVDFLRNYGVRAVIDLRDPSEVEADPDVSLGDDVAYANFRLLELDLSNRAQLEEVFLNNRPSIEGFYDLILQARENIAACFRFIAAAPEGCVLFHCMAGKDRTGTLALLLMALAGCDKWDCAASYVQSRVHLMRSPKFAKEWAINEQGEGDNYADSPARAIEHVWDEVEAAGGVESFLSSCGVSAEELAAVRARLLDA